MGLKAKVDAIIYAAEEPITAEQIAALLKDMALAEEAEERARAAATQESAEPSGETAVETAQENAPAEAIGSGEYDATQSTSEFEGDSTQEIAAAEAEIIDDAQVGPAPEDGGATSEVVSDVPAAPEPVPEFTPVPADPRAGLEGEADAQASVPAPDPVAGKRKRPSKKELTEDGRVTAKIRMIIEELIAEYQNEDRGMEIKAVAGGYRMATKPEHHDVVRAFSKSLKPPVKLSLAALETLAVIAYKQPITVPEITEIRGVESGGVIGTLLDRKLITTAGRKQVVGRPILYKTSKEFLLRFGLGGLSDLPSMEEFEKLASAQEELFTAEPAKEESPVEAPAGEGEYTEQSEPSTSEFPAEEQPEPLTEQPAVSEEQSESSAEQANTEAAASASESDEKASEPVSEESQAAEVPEKPE